MFENFFNFGFKNSLMDLMMFNKIEDDQFNAILENKIEHIRLTWKLFVNLIDFT